jgi:hypothetical protein
VGEDIRVGLKENKGLEVITGPSAVDDDANQAVVVLVLGRGASCCNGEARQSWLEVQVEVGSRP